MEVADLVMVLVTIACAVWVFVTVWSTVDVDVDVVKLFVEERDEAADVEAAASLPLACTPAVANAAARRKRTRCILLTGKQECSPKNQIDWKTLRDRTPGEEEHTLNVPAPRNSTIILYIRPSPIPSTEI